MWYPLTEHLFHLFLNYHTHTHTCTCDTYTHIHTLHIHTYTHYTYTHAYIRTHTTYIRTHTHFHSSKLINKSVPNTVDMRALTQISSTATKRARDEAEQENMTLVTESARAIGCHIFDTTGDKILCKDPETIRNLLVDLIRVRVLHGSAHVCHP